MSQIEVILDSPNGPKVVAPAGASEEEIESELPEGWTVGENWNNGVELSGGRWAYPLVHGDSREETMFRIAPASDESDFYAAGYDGNAFISREEAVAATHEEALSDGDWVVVEVPYDAAALRRAGYEAE